MNEPDYERNIRKALQASIRLFVTEPLTEKMKQLRTYDYRMHLFDRTIGLAQLVLICALPFASCHKLNMIVKESKQTSTYAQPVSTSSSTNTPAYLP